MAKRNQPPRRQQLKEKAQQAKRPQNVNLNSMFISSEVTKQMEMDLKKPYWEAKELTFQKCQKLACPSLLA